MHRLNEAMKLTVQRAKYHMDPKRFESYSLRIAGASIMAAAGIPNYTIKKIGRWKSDCFERYIRTGVQTHHAVTNVSFSLDTLTFDDVRRVTPGIHNISPVHLNNV